MKHFKLLLLVIGMLMTTGEVKAQAAGEEPGKNVVVDGLAYTLDKTAKTAAVIPNSFYVAIQGLTLDFDIIVRC